MVLVWASVNTLVHQADVLCGCRQALLHGGALRVEPCCTGVARCLSRKIQLDDCTIGPCGGTTPPGQAPRMARAPAPAWTGAQRFRPFPHVVQWPLEVNMPMEWAGQRKEFDPSIGGNYGYQRVIRRWGHLLQHVSVSDLNWSHDGISTKFPMHDLTRKTIKALEAQNTRQKAAPQAGDIAGDHRSYYKDKKQLLRATECMKD